jgi:hypothetical protein
VLRLVDLAHAAFADEAHHAIAIGENLPDEVRAQRLRVFDQRRAVARAEGTAFVVARVARGTDHRYGLRIGTHVSSKLCRRHGQL